MNIIPVICFLFLSCVPFGKDVPSATKETVKGVLLYEFKKNGDHYCELNSQLIIENKMLFFYDVRNFNVSILHKNKELQKGVGADTLYSHFIAEPDSTLNLNFSSFKESSRNVNGTAIISSFSFYSNLEKESVYIAFNFEGEVIHYKSVFLSRKDYSNHAKECCPLKNSKVEGEFCVLSKVLKTSKLNSTQESLLNLVKLSKTENIEIFYCD